MKPTTLTLVAAVMLAGSNHLEAALVVHEAYAYTPGSPLAGAAGGTGFGANAWTDNENQPPVIAATSLAYTGVQTSGGAARLTGSANDRDFPNYTPANGSTTWLSYLFTTTNSTIASGAIARFYVGPNFAGRRAYFGIYESAGGFYFGIENELLGPQFGANPLAFQVQTTYLVVASITWDTALVNPEMIRLYINPALDGSTLATPLVTRSDINIETTQTSTGVSRLARLGLEAGGATWIFDELRIATGVGATGGFASVIPEPSSAGLAVMAGGLLGLFAVRFRRMGARREAT